MEFEIVDSRLELELDSDLELKRFYEDESKVRSFNSRILSSLSNDLSEYQAISSPDIYQHPAHLSEACARGKYRAEHGVGNALQAENKVNRYIRLTKMLDEQKKIDNMCIGGEQPIAESQKAKASFIIV
eukprot:CAMPEP_0184701342 /NCGR_PEP_ID=MMETSP0313-20130426/19447_1 /TAXON_ID=2792 /ORGANISM="Porphyridium aerugineum, Strain SAG 1380-2" /LENGTH=128 /DNA_ID=CAMNT_0027161373 /DNA_START=41 /DNA_END=424 /DNA_ORIENTATION=-